MKTQDFSIVYDFLISSNRGDIFVVSANYIDSDGKEIPLMLYVSHKQVNTALENFYDPEYAFYQLAPLPFVGVSTYDGSSVPPIPYDEHFFDAVPDQLLNDITEYTESINPYHPRKKIDKLGDIIL